MRKSNQLIKLIILIPVFITLNFSLFSLIPPTKDQVEKYKRNGTWNLRVQMAESFGNNKISKSLVRRFQHKMELLLSGKISVEENKLGSINTIPPAWEGMPTTGNVKIPVILISFQDKDHINSKSSIYGKIFGSGESSSFPLESLRSFYLRSSYNKLNITGNVLGWYKTQYSRNEAESKGRDNLIKEVLNFYDSNGHDFTQYDNDNDGDIDYLVVIWSGEHGEWASFWWAYQTSFSDAGYRIDGKSLGTYSWQWESYHYPSDKFDPSTLIHETGHALGLPDLYDYKEGVGPEGGVGGLDIMDSIWGDHNCFSKFLLDWIVPKVVNSGETDKSLSPSSISDDALLVMPGGSEKMFFGEFFMVQNRTRIGNDLKIPTDGLIIWHVDSTLDDSQYDFKYDNSYTDHKYLKLMEADGLDQIENFEYADAGDFYVSGDRFSPATIPDSKKYDGTNSGVFVKNIYRQNNDFIFNVGVDIPLEIKLEGKRNEEKSWLIKNYYAQLSFSVKFFREIDVIKYSVQRKKEKSVYKSVKEISPDELKEDSISVFDKYLEKERKYFYRIIAFGSDGSIIGISNEITL